MVSTEKSNVMRSQRHKSTNDENGPMNHGVEGNPDEPATEPGSATSTSAEWKVPTSTEPATDEPAGHASAPDASPLLEQEDADPTGGSDGFWREGGAISGKTSNSQQIPPQQ